MSNRIRKLVDVHEVNMRRFEEIYPQRGSFTWFVNSCLEAFNTAHEVTPDDYVKQAVGEVLNLDNGGE